MLLFLVKHLSSDLANVIRKLLKANNGVNPATFKELLHVIINALDMKNLGLKLNP